MASLRDLEKKMGNHRVILDQAAPGTGSFVKYVPNTVYWQDSYAAALDSLGFKTPRKETYDMYTSGVVKHVKEGHILNKQMVYVNETDRETINPSMLLNLNPGAEVPSVTNRTNVVGDGKSSGVTRAAHNKNLVRDHSNHPGLVFGSGNHKSDPKFKHGTQESGPNKGINDPLRTMGNGTFNGARYNKTFMQRVNKNHIGDVRSNPNRIRGGPECRNPGYLIDSLTNNPLSIYRNGKYEEWPQFNLDSSCLYDKKNQVKRNNFSDTNNQGIIYDINRRLPNHCMLYY